VSDVDAPVGGGDRLPVVHIGYARTGSTWLQEVVFPRMHGVRSAHASDIWRSLSWKLGTAEDEGYLERTLQTFVDEFSTRAGDAALVFSQEMFSGYWLDPQRTTQRSAERVKRLFPEAKILVVTRNQDDIIRGLYGLYVRTGGHRAFRDVLDSRPIEGWHWDGGYLEYDRLVERYVELYGRERVKVLPHELARAEPARFLADLSEFCGAGGYDDYETLTQQRVNTSFSPPAAFVLRFWNRLFVRSQFNSKPSLGARSAGLRAHQILAERVDPLLRRAPWPWPLPADRRRLELLVAGYAASNARLQHQCDYPLAALGYQLGSDAASVPAFVPEAAA
jgi:hypothetical protein